MNLHSALNELAASFASSVLNALRSASLEDLMAESSKSAGPALRRATRGFVGNGHATATPKVAHTSREGRLKHRGPEDIAKALDQVIALVKKHKAGLRAEQVRAKLGMQAKEMPRILKEGLSKKVLKSKGQKRATTYFAG